MFDQFVAAYTAARTLGEGLRACAQLENAACAARLRFMAEMLAAAYHADGSNDREQWRQDNWAAVCSSIGAVHAVTSGVASTLLMDAVALAERLPKVQDVFARGLISYRLVRAICERTSLVQDSGALAALDADLANELCTRGAMSVAQAKQDIDALVLRHDPYALRRTQTRVRGEFADVTVDGASGTAELNARLSATDGQAIDERADRLARTVCEHDPRTHDQRRAAAFGVMGFGWDRMPCLCERPDCDAATRPPAGGVVVHVITRQETIAPERQPEPEQQPEPETAAPVGDAVAQRRSLVGHEPPLLPKPWHSYTLPELCNALNADPGEYCPVGPGVTLGGVVLPAPVAAQAALDATVRALVHPGRSLPEHRYRPSRRLAEFVRCRDLTCRFPGCSRPATVADLDHTLPWPYGPTCASNLKCLCREHHLLKTFSPGWSDRQLPDGTVIWTDPDGLTHTTHPGSRLLFPELCAPTAEVMPVGSPPAKHTAGLTMPRRKITRAEARRRRIADERRRNDVGDDSPDVACEDPYFPPISRLPADDDPPPF